MAKKKKPEAAAPSSPTSPTGQLTRVRKCPPRGCSVKERVEWIVHLMAGWSWDSRRSIESLSVHWNIDAATVRKDSAEANRLLQYDPADLDYERRRHRRSALKARRIALRSLDADGRPDLTNYLKANEQAARFSGIDIAAPAVRVSVNSTVNTHDDLLSRLARIAAAAGAGTGNTKPDG